MKQLLPQTNTIRLGEVKDQELERETVVAVVYDVESKLFLCQYWSEYSGLTCMLSGGVEVGEDWESTVCREIAEETGYVDFTIKGMLGGMIESHYTKADGQNYVKFLQPYFVELNSPQRVVDQKEDDEKFENFLKAPDEIIDMMTVYEQRTGSSLADHKEILRRGVEYAR